MGRGFVCVSRGKKLYISSKLIKAKFDWGRPPESLDYIHDTMNKRK